MHPATDALYLIHQTQAQRRGRSPLPYEMFRARLPETYETDLTKLLLPATEVKLTMEFKPSTHFALGLFCITPEAFDALSADEILTAVRRHAAGDWGNVYQDKWQENDSAMRDGGQLFSVYESSCGRKFWVVTTAERNLTTVMLPEQC